MEKFIRPQREHDEDVNFCKKCTTEGRKGGNQQNPNMPYFAVKNDFDLEEVKLGRGRGKKNGIGNVAGTGRAAEPELGRTIADSACTPNQKHRLSGRCRGQENVNARNRR